VNRVQVLVEGETELDFVKEVLCPHLAPKGVAVGVSLFGGRSGGIVRWPRALKRICLQMKEDQATYVTTFVDYYGLPESWPGRNTAGSRSYSERSAHITEHLAAAVAAEIGDRMRPCRFIPFVMIHEFETLIFSDPKGCARAWALPEIEPALSAVCREFVSPEQINDSPSTAPSKRLISIFAGLAQFSYNKRHHGNLAALEFGIENLVAACPQFGAWVRRLEGLGADPSI